MFQAKKNLRFISHKIVFIFFEANEADEIYNFRGPEGIILWVKVGQVYSRALTMSVINY